MKRRSQKQRILFIEDDRAWQRVATDQLQRSGYEVHVEENGLDGLDQARLLKPDLILVDIGLPGIDGLTVCRELRRDPATQMTPIMMLTSGNDELEGFEAGTDDYVQKMSGLDIIEKRIERLLWRVRGTPSSDAVLSLYCEHGKDLKIRAEGALGLTATSREPLSLDPAVYIRAGSNALDQADWRFESKKLGSELYGKVLADHSESSSTYYYLHGWVHAAEKLHLRFECRRGDLGIPFEFLYDEGRDQQGFHFALRHPLARRILGVLNDKQPLSSEFFGKFVNPAKPLKILLIASNTLPTIPGVDAEIAELDAKLSSFFADQNIYAQIHTVPTAKASMSHVQELLRKCEYHIVHYAGHGIFDSAAPNQSCLKFWESPDTSNRKVMSLAVRQLEHLLIGSETRFVYLSCCSGTTTGPAAQLLSDDFLGIADGLIHAGIPSVLGFRRTVSDQGAKLLATSFYAALAESQEVDTALLKARFAVYADNLEDRTWLSPVLIQQS